MERVIELALKLPLKLGMVEVAWVHFEGVRVHRNRAMCKLYQDFDSIPLRVRVEAQQRMLIKL